ncbi:MAG: gliding motility-associated C-terminal domain-containing protein [Bacteroidetes bacterium]|nr:gliding motility-associated C-terminal domain-containing protein [Bacteroidota bacterium]
MRHLLLLLLLLARIIAWGQPPCNISVQITPPTCPDDLNASITLVPNAPGQYTYTWAQDPALHGPVATGLGAGPYSVTVTDTSGCISQIDTTVAPPVLPDLGSLTATNISCAGMNDGSITLTVNPGPYTWQWTDDPANHNFTRTGLGPGVYVVLISGGICPNWLFADLGDPGVNIGGDATYCPADPPTLWADMLWGFQPDVFQWSTGATSSWIQVQPGTTGPITLTATNSATGCTSTGTINLTMQSAPVSTFSAPDSLCLRSPGLGVLLSTNADSLVWRWGSTGFSNEPFPTITFDSPGWQPITLQGFDATGCGSAPLPDSVFVRPRFPAHFTTVQVPCTPGIEVHFDSQADSCAFFVGQRLVLNQCRGTFRVDLERYAEYDFTFYSTRPDHCDDTASARIDVCTAPTAFLPNAFTPNNDGINDTWPGHLDIPDLNYQVQVFNRWGESLWATTNPEEKWDGGNLPPGVYIYRMTMRDPCNPTSDLQRNGFITLLR